MELFSLLFGDLLAFVYHCFDRIVIYGYLSALSRPEQVVHFFRPVVGVPVVSKEVLSQRTADYQNWVEAFARNHQITIEWAEKGVRKEDHVLPSQRRMTTKGAYGVYFILKSMEQGATFRVTVPKYPTKDPNYRILAHQRSRFTHFYFYIRDEVLGPMVMRVGSFFPFQTTYYLNGHNFIEQELNRAQISVIALFGGLVSRLFDGLPVPLPVPCRGLWKREAEVGGLAAVRVRGFRVGTAVLLLFRAVCRGGSVSVRRGGSRPPI